MIEIKKFKEFIYLQFSSDIIYYDEFKDDLHFSQIDCFGTKPYKLMIEISIENIKFSTVSKEPEIDFSLYEYVEDTNISAEKFLLKIKNGTPPAAWSIRE